MQLDLKTEEFKEMAEMLFSDKIERLEKELEECRKDARMKGLRISELEDMVAERDEKIDRMGEQLYELSVKMNEAAITAWAQKQFVPVSKKKAQVYVRGIDGGTRAVIGHFMLESLPDDAPQIFVEYVSRVTMPEPPVPTINVGYADTVNGVGEHIDQMSIGDGAILNHNYNKERES